MKKPTGINTVCVFLFQMICAYIFMPVAYLMGVPWKDASVVGELLGIKTFLNEFLAYKELSGFMENRLTCTGQLISVSHMVLRKIVTCLYVKGGLYIFICTA